MKNSLWILRRGRPFAGAVAAACLLGYGVIPAAAQPSCATRQDVVEFFSAQYQESPSARGLVADHLVVELLTSRTGSWTILITRPNGTSCIVAKGEDWESFEKEAESLPPAASQRFSALIDPRSASYDMF